MNATLPADPADPADGAPGGSTNGVPTASAPPVRRTPPKKKARELAAALRRERPDYAYLKSVFRALRAELDIPVPRGPKRLPYVPSEDAIRRYYQTVWQARNVGDIVLIKTLLYTGVRVSELVHIRLDEVDFDRCQVRITAGKGNKDRVVPFPAAFKEALALHAAALRAKGAMYLFESSWKKRYSDRGVRKLLARYATAAGLAHPVSPHQLRHFLLTWLKKQGIDDALIQPYSGHASRQSLEIYSRLALADAQQEYDRAMERFPV
jgi:integrase/recombinase XerD